MTSSEQRAFSQPQHLSKSSIRKRYRALQSCASCRSRKLKCDRQRPCQKCRTAHRDCVFRSTDDVETELVTSSRNSLHTPIDVDFSAKTPQSTQSKIDSASDHLSDLHTTFYTDATYDDFGDDSEVEEGVQLGRLRISQRMGGYYQPDLATRLSIPLRAVLRRKYPGDTDESLSLKITHPAPTISGSCRLGQEFASPSSGALFDGNSVHFQLGADLLNRAICENILAYYWGTFHILFKCLHRPSFEYRWNLFWTILDQGSEPPSSLESLVMGVLLSGCIAMPDMGVVTTIGISKSTLIHRFRAAAEAALVRAKFVRTSKLETLQALIIYLLATCRDELSKEYFAVLSIAINIAESIGLYRDPTLFRFGAIDIHVRGLLWHQLCFLDMRACDARRPRPHIREEDFDTPIPLPTNDANLERTARQLESVWTDTTFSIMRFEISEFHRTVWLVRGKLDRKEVELSDTLERIIGFKQNMRAKYAFLNQNVPIQRFASLVMEFLADRFLIMVLHRYHDITISRLPEQLRHLLIDKSISVLSNVITLETSPELLPWAWALRAWMPSLVAFLLLKEVTVNPDMQRADDIWRIVDYMFLQPPGLSRDDKSIAVLKETYDKVIQLSTKRRIHVPNGQNNLQVITENSMPRDSNDHSAVSTPFDGTSGLPETIVSSYLQDPIPPSTFSQDYYHVLLPQVEDLDVGSDFDWAQWTESFPMDS